MDKTAQSNSSTSTISSPYASSGYRSLVYSIIIVGVVAIAALSFWAFQYAQQKGNQAGWSALVEENGISGGNQNINADSANIVYELEGIIAELNPTSIVLEKDGQKKEFSTILTNFVVVDALQYIEEWPTRIVKEGREENFQIGDKVTVLVTGKRISTNFTVKQIIKVQQ